MGIKKDALELLAHLYNDKTGDKPSNLDELYELLDFSEKRFTNTYNYLKEKNLITEKERNIGKTAKGLPNITGLQITSLGIDSIEEEDVFRDNFGSLNIEINQNGQVNVVNQNKSPTVNLISAPDLEDVSYKDTRDIYYGPVTHAPVILDDSATYGVDKENVAFMEKASIKIIDKYGERNTTIVGAVSLASGLITVFGASYSVLYSISGEYRTIVSVVGLLLAIFGLLLIRLVQYKHESRCPNSKCKRFYALKEVGDPIEKEVRVRGGVRITTTRMYECKYCGHEITKKKNKFIHDSQFSNK